MFPKKDHILFQEMTSRFVDDPSYHSNFNLYCYFSLAIRKEFSTGNTLKFNIDYMPNFKDSHSHDYIQFEVETTIYDISDSQNHRLVETIDNVSTRFELRQGGITFSLRYYPKIFKMNARD